MGQTTISWTDESSNPIRFRRKDNGKKGWACIKQSAGCKSCYSERTNKWVGTGLDYTVSNMELVEPFIVEKEVNRLLGLREPRKIFICDMTDLFGEFIPKEMVFQVLAVIALCARQTFQVLTKRADRMEAFMADPETANALEYYTDKICGEHGFCAFDYEWPLPNLHLGATVEDAGQLSRVDHLLGTPAAVRFVSCEPLLSALDLSRYLKCQWYQDTEHPVPWKPGDVVDRVKYPHQGYPAKLRPCLDQVIAGFETGIHARPGHPNWARGLRDQCQKAGVPFHFKSFGEWHPEFKSDNEPICPVCGCTDSSPCEGGCYWIGDKNMNDRCNRCANIPSFQWPDGSFSYRVGHKASGRQLDGRVWDEFPERYR